MPAIGGLLAIRRNPEPLKCARAGDLVVRPRAGALQKGSADCVSVTDKCRPWRCVQYDGLTFRNPVQRRQSFCADLPALGNSKDYQRGVLTVQGSPALAGVAQNVFGPEQAQAAERQNPNIVSQTGSL